MGLVCGRANGCFHVLAALYRSLMARRYSLLVSSTVFSGPTAPRLNYVLTASHSNRSVSSMAVRAICMASVIVSLGSSPRRVIGADFDAPAVVASL